MKRRRSNDRRSTSDSDLVHCPVEPSMQQKDSSQEMAFQRRIIPASIIILTIILFAFQAGVQQNGAYNLIRDVKDNPTQEISLLESCRNFGLHLESNGSK